MKVTFNQNNNLTTTVKTSATPINVVTNQSGDINANVVQPTTYTVEVDNVGGRLQTNAPISLRNVVSEGAQATVDRLEDIGDVVAIEKVDGASVVYNSAASRYEVKNQDLDGGSF